MQIFNTATLSQEEFDEILTFLRSGGVIGFPTDTAYGLGADASNESGIRRIFEIKGRAETKPILVLVNSFHMVQQVAKISETAWILGERLWPGPLTLVLPALETVPRSLTAGTLSIGVRWPKAPFATRLLEALGKPLTATSANRSGMPAAATAEDVRAQLQGALEILVDGGTLPEPGGSTMLDLTKDPPVLLREGPVAFEVLKETLKGKIRR